VKRYLDQEGLSRRIPVLVGTNETEPFVEAVYYAAPGGESAEDAIARMVAVRDAEQRERRAKHRRELQEAADSMCELRKAIRETRLWPSPQMRRLREYYEAKEAMVAVSHPLGRVPKPSWTITDDGEFERFLERYYVDPFIR